MIAIIDYGRGNLASVANSLNHLGLSYKIVMKPDDLRETNAVILPGVGAFDDAMKSLRETGLADALTKEVAAGKPFLGICLGMQLLFDSSEEGSEAGLGILKGRVRRFNFVDAAARSLKVPHTGWNSLHVQEGDLLLEDGSEVYFVHSYYVLPDDKTIVSAVTDYGGSFCSAIRQDKIFGVQFHPEKSGNVGLEILKRFGELV